MSIFNISFLIKISLIKLFLISLFLILIFLALDKYNYK